MKKPQGIQIPRSAGPALIAELHPDSVARPLSPQPGSSYSASLCLSFLICKTEGKNTFPAWQMPCKHYLKHKYPEKRRQKTRNAPARCAGVTGPWPCPGSWLWAADPVPPGKKISRSHLDSRAPSFSHLDLQNQKSLFLWVQNERGGRGRRKVCEEPRAALSLCVWSLCSATREAVIVRGPRIAMKSGPRLPQLEKALAQKRRPNTAINKQINSNLKKKMIN